jgi:hypothetical protein
VRVWIQRGHCFRRTGSTGTTGEQAYVNDIGNRAAVLLRTQGHTVKVALADERISGQWDVFVALHCDGSTSKTASGASVGYRVASGRTVASHWKTRYRARGWPYGFRGDNYTPALQSYYGTSWAASAGIKSAFILEHGFLTNPAKDRAWLTTAEGRTAAAMALADTVEVLAGKEPKPDDDLEATMFCERGNRGVVVRHWQIKLRDLGYYMSEIDGVYGPNMASAVLSARMEAGSDATNGDKIDAYAKKQIDLLWTRWAVKGDVSYKRLEQRADKQNSRILDVERMHRVHDATNSVPHVPIIEDCEDGEDSEDPVVPE